MTVVAVRGESVREVEPELAEFTVTVNARGKDRETVLHRLRERAAGLRTLLDQHADAIERRETGGMHVQPETGKRGERVTAYSGAVSTMVTLHDFTALGELMLTLANQDQTQIYGPSWLLRPDSPVHAEARRAAITEAISRAREYAEVLGAELVDLVELSDPGLGHQDQRYEGLGVSLSARGSTTGGAPDLQLDPQRRRVYAAVEARFTISSPTVL